MNPASRPPGDQPTAGGCERAAGLPNDHESERGAETKTCECGKDIANPGPRRMTRPAPGDRTVPGTGVGYATGRGHLSCRRHASTIVPR